MDKVDNDSDDSDDSESLLQWLSIGFPFRFGALSQGHGSPEVVDPSWPTKLYITCHERPLTLA